MRSMLTDTVDRPPRQERSRRTLARLMAATIWTLDEVGLEAATIPRIARKAEVAPATIYRRFENKQALLRAAFLHMLERSNQANRAQLQQRLGTGSLAQAARQLIDLMFAQYAKHHQLMRSLIRFLESDDDPGFRAKALAFEESNLEQVIQAMLAHRDAMHHPDPERAVRIATLTAATSIRTMAFEPGSIWRTARPQAQETLAGELARAYVAYLESAS